MASSNIFVRFFRFIWRGLDGLRRLLHLVLLVLIFSVVMTAFRDTTPIPPRNAALEIRPVGFLVDELEGDAFSRAVAELQGNAVPQTLVRDVVEALDRARTDDNVPAVVLSLDYLYGGGLTKLEAVAEAIAAFRESGKPVYATGTYFSQESYYLAAHASEVWMAPTGGVFFTGYGRYGNYFKDAIDKLSINWNVFRVGEYKSYAEPFIRNDMSVEARDANVAWLSDLWTSYLENVAEARGLPVEVLTAMADRPAEFVTSVDASWTDTLLETGLVNELLTSPEVFDRLQREFGQGGDDEGRYNAIGMSDYLATKRLLDVEAFNGAEVAIVVASGPVVDGDAPPGQIGGVSTSRLIRKARLDDDVKALVVHIDSGGGSVLASDAIRSELDAFRASGRPYVASMGSVAASAGYWIAAPAERIFASANTITGSIGVVGMFPTFEDSLGKLGVYTDGVGTAPLAGQFRPDRPLNDTARALIQAMIEADYDRFVGGVADYRQMEKEAVDKVARGRVWSGADALEIGLVDEFGDLDAAVAHAASLADLAEGDYRVRYVEREVSPFEQFVLDISDMAQSRGLALQRSSSATDKLLKELKSSIDAVARFNDPRGIYSVCFCVP